MIIICKIIVPFEINRVIIFSSTLRRKKVELLSSLRRQRPGRLSPFLKNYQRYPFETWNTCSLSKEEPITTRQMTLWFAELSALVSTYSTLQVYQRSNSQVRHIPPKMSDKFESQHSLSPTIWSDVRVDIKRFFFLHFSRWICQTFCDRCVFVSVLSFRCVECAGT